MGAELPEGKDADSAHSHCPSEGAQPATSLRCSAIGGQRLKRVAVPLHFVAKELVRSGLRSRLPGDGMLRPKNSDASNRLTNPRYSFDKKK